ncbi:MAG TPA: sigma-54 dependent transcriptional regulator [Roseimicrobium sp.]|nr:sigma-54 dependent transcriptional regulator [Roseimicrobium sp.]
MIPKILIIDDQFEVRDMLRRAMTKLDFTVSELDGGQALMAALGKESAPDVVLLDLKLGDSDGIDLLPPLKQRWPEAEVIVLTGNATIDAAVAATKLGAYDFHQKPFQSKSIQQAVMRALEHKRLREEAGSLRRALSGMSGGVPPIFQSAAMQEVLRVAERVAPSEVSVLITGESGTGKEVIADLIHALSPRAQGPFVKINCAALPRELIESELFGAVKGAYTGAHSDREGLLRQAEGGTLLLDELSEMPVETQTKLLRVLQEREVRPVGGRTSYRTDCRIIAATNRPVEQAIQEGHLRADLYYRIGAIIVSLPPLRERREDIVPLAQAFLKRFAAQAGRGVAGFTQAALEQLRLHEWPGNVRQLQNEIQRGVLMCEGTEVDLKDLSIMNAGNGSTESSEARLTLMQGVERNTILQMLRETGGNKLETSRRLGIGRQTLYNKMRVYGISEGDWTRK